MNNNNVENLYEKKIILDEECPFQILNNRIQKKGGYFTTHWHEHIELHYIIEGKSSFGCDRKKLSARKDSLVIFNGNELHDGTNESSLLNALVIIFEMKAFSKELANRNIIFHNLIEADRNIKKICLAIYAESIEQQEGYKLAMKGYIYRLITYLVRNFAAGSLTESENRKRSSNLVRLNTVLQYIHEHYKEEVSNRELADIMHLSESRFNHVFKESIGISPLQYINEMRLKEARFLLMKKNMTITQVADASGFSDSNHFGRLFKKRYGCSPSEVWKV